MSVPTKTHLVIGTIVFIILCGVIVLGFVILLSPDNTSDNQNQDVVESSFGETYNVFFSRQGGDCQDVFAVERSFGDQPSYQEVFEELLKGPNFEETKEGFRSNLPSGVSIKSFDLKPNGELRIDLNQAFLDVAGSCRVQAIRSQIDETMTQFDEIREVILSVDGSTDIVLQP